MTSFSVSTNFLHGPSRVNLMSSGSLVSPSQPVSRLLCYNKALENSEFRLINSDGTSSSYHTILPARSLQRKVPMSKVSILKELNGMEKKHTLSTLSPWSCTTKCQSYGSSLFTLRGSRSRKKECKTTPAPLITTLLEQDKEKNHHICLLYYSLLNPTHQPSAPQIKTSG